MKKTDLDALEKFLIQLKQWSPKVGSEIEQLIAQHHAALKVVDRIEEECRKFGLEDMGGNHADVLIRHMDGSKAVTLGAKDATIRILEGRVEAAI